MNTTLLNTITQATITYAECLAQKIEFSYQFAWLFVIAFLFNEMSYFIMSWNFKPHVKTMLIRNMKILAFVMNMIGVIWFFILIIK